MSSTRTQRQLTATQIVYIYIYIYIYVYVYIWRTFCLSLKRRNLQTIVRGRDPMNFSKQWHWSILMLRSIFELLKTSSCTFHSQSSQVSLVSSVILSKRRLLHRNLSSNVINFFGTLFGSRSSSSTCISDFFFERIFFTIPSSSFSSTYVTSKLFVISRTSLDILSRRSLVFCNWDFKISLRFFSFCPSSSLIILLVVLTSSSLLSSLCTEVVGVFF